MSQKEVKPDQLTVRQDLVDRAERHPDWAVRRLAQRYKAMADGDVLYKDRESRDRNYDNIEACIIEIVHGGASAPGALSTYGFEGV